jgi:hypothetical protein
MKPVAFPPGCARLSTKPLPTGSMAVANTTGILLVASSTGGVVVPPPETMISGFSASNSATPLRMSAALG